MRCARKKWTEWTGWTRWTEWTRWTTGLLVLAAFAAETREVSAAEQLDYRQLYDKAAPSVVQVTTVESFPEGLKNRTVDLVTPFPVFRIPVHVLSFVFYPLFAFVNGPLKWSGSGVIIDKEGRFLTNYHVIGGGDIFWATLQDGRIVRCRLIGGSKEEDYALLKMELEKGVEVQPAPLGDSEALRPGDRVFAIGNPLLYKSTLSIGVVAGLDRRVSGPFQDFVQTDLTVGSGSSGGPLFNEKGDVVGLTSRIAVLLDVTSGVSFSVPINAVKDGLPRIEKAGKVTYGFIGAEVKTVTPRLVEKLRLDPERKSGAVITEIGVLVLHASPAAQAGLRKGDVVVSYGGGRIETGHDLARAVLRTAPGTEVPVEFYRGEELLTRTITVTER